MKTKSLMLLALVLLTATVILVGCKKKEEPAPPPKASAVEKIADKATASAEEAKKTAETTDASTEQTTCPIMDGNKINKNVFVEYKGKKVYFCCAACKSVFEADPEKYISKLPQFKK
ncbi:MAG: YHS domain-containing protein [Phycisphaerae bacterium]|nr:YHS domain-containing protein [Phycisphaerae bacterium]MDD5380078.1 YHS domain-containing protein [Phycisphaerae bacterium]